MKTAYVPKSFNDTHLGVIRQAEAICNEYAAQGYELTLRQLYYQFIARDLFPESRRDKVSGTKNTDKNYNWLGELLGDARLAGQINWSHMTDRTRTSEGGDGGYGSPENAIRSMADWYGITHWDGQPNYVEVWVEKEALADVVGRAAREWDVAHMACRGYVSLSAMHESALRLRSKEGHGRSTHVLYLGDHDPSGIDMSRDIQDRLAMFRSSAKVHRIALNMDQVEQYDPPPSPAKLTDSRAQDYIELYGTDSWELDALDPATLNQLIQDNIEPLCEADLRQARLDQEEEEKQVLAAFADNFWQLREHLQTEGLLSADEEDE